MIVRFKVDLACGVVSVLLGTVSCFSLAEPCSSNAPIPYLKAFTAEQRERLGPANAVDVYVDHDTVHLLVASNRGQGTELIYLNTSDFGQSWSKPAVIPTERPPTVSRRGNDAQIVASGTRLLAVWQSQGELPGMGPMSSAYSRDRGRTWITGPMPADSKNTDQSHMDAIADADGRFHLVWLDDREEAGNYQGLRYARTDDGGEHWDHYATLDRTTCTCCWTSLAIDPNNALYALYRDGDPHDMAMLYSADHGEHWSARGKVGAFGWQFQGCPHAGGGLVATGIGHLHSVVWTGKDSDAGLYFMRTANEGQSWSAGRFPDNKAVHADIAAMDAKQLLAVWDSSQGVGSEIFAAHSCDGGVSWSAPQRLSSASRKASYPRLVATSKGFLPLWTEHADNGQSLLGGLQ